MSRQDLSISTPDGDARAFAFRPEAGGAGPWRAVIMFMDAPAIRPALFDMAQRLANDGNYYVLLPDLFWRARPYEPIDIKAAFSSDETRRAAFAKLRGSTDVERQTRDTKACLDFLETQKDVAPGPVGVTGYCMGGAIALRAAGLFPDRVVAAASFHGGNLATDADDSPHLLASKIKAKVLVAGADEDRSFDEAQKARLDRALTDAGVDAEVTIYQGAKHGYAPADMPVYDKAASERHFREMEALFRSTLG